MNHTQDPSVMADNTNLPEPFAWWFIPKHKDGKTLAEGSLSFTKTEPYTGPRENPHCQFGELYTAEQVRALLSRPSGEVVGTGASELLGYAPKHDDLLKGIRDNLNIMLASARTHSDGDFVSGYTIKTGALHRIIGLLQIAGFPVIVPAAPAAPASPEARDALTDAFAQAFAKHPEISANVRLDIFYSVRAAMAASKEPQS